MLGMSPSNVNQFNFNSCGQSIIDDIKFIGKSLSK